MTSLRMNADTNRTWNGNVAFLQSRTSPDTLRLLKDAAEAPPCVEAHRRADGTTELLRIRSGQRFPLHSRRDPRREAAGQAAEIMAGGAADGCVVLGMAGIYHLEALAERLPAGALLAVIDPDPGQTAAVLRHVSLLNLSGHEVRFCLICNPDPECACREFRSMLRKLDRFELATFVHPSMRRIHPELCGRLEQGIGAEIKLETSDRITRAALAAEWLDNAFDNLPYILKNRSVAALENQFQGQTALVAAAGPTLNDTLPQIRKLAAIMPVFAVGTAVKPLLAGGVIPDFIVALDSDIRTLRQLPEQNLPETILLAACSCPREMCGRFDGRILFFSFSGMNGFNCWLERGGTSLCSLNVGGTVALTAIDAALKAGCGTVILTGLDLAVKDDGTTHAKNSMYDGAGLPEEQKIMVQGNYRRRVPSTAQFVNYARQLNAYFADMVAEHGVKFYNATTGGVLFDNTAVVRPEDMPGLFSAAGNDDKRSILQSLIRSAGQPHDISGYLAESVTALRRLSGDAAGAGQLCEKLENGMVAPDAEAMKRLDSLDEKMKNNPVSELTEVASAEMLRIFAGKTKSFESGRKRYSLLAEMAARIANKMENASNRL